MSLYFFAIVGFAACVLIALFLLDIAIRFFLRFVVAIIMVRQWKREEQS